MNPCAARSARTLFNKHEIVRGSHPDFAWRVEFFGARHARASDTQCRVCEVEGESPGLVRNFEARASVRVSLALKFAGAAAPARARDFSVRAALLARVERARILAGAS